MQIRPGDWSCGQDATPIRELETAHLAEYSNKIDRAVDKMLQLISDISDSSKIENGTFS
jgi:hypothetical protein